VTKGVPPEAQAAPDSGLVAAVVLRVWRLRVWVWLWFLGAMPASILAYWLSGSDTVMWCVGAFCAVMSCAGGMAAGIIQCPRCRQFLFVGERSTNPFSGRCLHCGLLLKP
jgi:hypothetical protein